ncbi:MAG: hypothetical protein GC189_00010 [Alphaproteobacteria bacterium]|nr:hypothetical protein [Alphaproteobacteria bacterium]
MERAALIFGVILALGFVVFGAVERSGGIAFHIGDVERAPVFEAEAGDLPEVVFPGDTLRVTRAAAVLRVLPEDRSDFAISIANPGGTPMPEIDLDGDTVIIDGRLAGRIGDCLEDGGATLQGYGRVERGRLPVITVRAPRDLALKVEGAVSADIGPIRTGDLTFSGCATSTVAEVAETLDLNAAGSGDIEVGATGPAEVRLAGSGAVTLGVVRDSLDTVIAGSGELRAASLTGRLEARGAGSGSTTIDGGAITEADISLAGSGDILIAAPVQTLKARIVGSGDITVAGAVGDIDANIAGSGDVRVASLTGRMEQRSMGSGGVVVGD